MSANPQSGNRSFLKTPATPVIVLIVIIALLLAFPAYRLFFLASVGIGLLVAGILFFWHRFKPVREEDIDIDHKRPLGL